LVLGADWSTEGLGLDCKALRRGDSEAAPRYDDAILPSVQFGDSAGNENEGSQLRSFPVVLA
jgi:hypothetical protein